MYYIKTADGWKPWIASHKVCDNHNGLQGVFKNTSDYEIMAAMGQRSDRFCALMAEGDAGQFNEPLFGAYGEKL